MLKFSKHKKFYFNSSNFMDAGLEFGSSDKNIYIYRLLIKISQSLLHGENFWGEFFIII